MPIVFVHGVNNRRGGDYEDNEVGRNGFLLEIVAPALGVPGKNVRIFSPYWGGDGAKFAWNMAVLPDASDDPEALGGNHSEALIARRVEEFALALELKGTLVESARRDFAATIEALYGSMLAAADTEQDGRDAAASYLAATGYAQHHPRPAWLDDEGLVDENFADMLANELSKSQDDDESFGARSFLAKLKEGARRLRNAIPDAASDLLVRSSRKKLNASAGLFIGDVFTYLKNRGTSENPGPVVKTVLTELRAAVNETTGKEKLIVIAHSFGGEVMYDILTHFAPELVVDVLITVGSQVGLFEEMKLFVASNSAIPQNPGEERVKVPSNLVRWINVYDENDVLAYKVEPVFGRVKDFSYDTGYSTLAAHGGYFLQPSFYTRLAHRLGE